MVVEVAQYAAAISTNYDAAQFCLDGLLQLGGLGVPENGKRAFALKGGASL